MYICTKSTIMEDRITHYKFESVIYKIKHYKDTNQVPLGNITELDNIIVKPKSKWDRSKVEVSVSEEEFVKYFADVTKGVSMEKLLIVVEEYDNKISYKIYTTTRRRKVGGKYFFVRKSLRYVTYNLNSKNVYTGYRQTSKKKLISKSCRVNLFSDIVTPHYIMNEFKTESRIAQGFKVTDYKSAVDEMDDLKEKLSQLIFNKTGIKTFKEISIRDIFYKLYLLDNGIKIPNTFRLFQEYFFSKKELKQSKNLVTAFMNKEGLYGSKVRAYLNKYEDIPFIYLSLIFKVLGVDYFNMVNVENLRNSGTIYIPGSLANNMNEVLSKRDRYKILVGINEGISFSTLLEHFSFREKLKKYNHKFNIKFFDRKSFADEHYEISQVLGSYKNGIIKRSYGHQIENMVEQSIVSMMGIEFFPVLLKTTEDYNSESIVQSNCVRTYVEKPNCLIISLRNGNKNSEDRATLEYQYRRNEIIRIQSRSKYNNDVPPSWEQTLEILDYRISKLYKDGKLTLPSLTKEYPNGVVINRYSVFEKETDVINTVHRLTPCWDDSINGDSENFFDLGLFE